jgi:metal-dependent amidase/aminoacylase/carboxypeptidase family protein
LNREFEPQKPEEKPRDILISSASTHFVGKVGYNILAREGGTQWVLRVLHTDYKEKRKEILEKIKKIIKEETTPWLKTGLKIDFKFNPGYRPLIHRYPEIVNIARKSAQDIIGSRFKLNEEASLAGEDFSFYLENFRGKEIPGAFIMVGGG